MDPNIAQQQIAEYIRANGEKYTREAIRDQLVAAGHDPAQIDAALEREMGSARDGAPGAGLAVFAMVLFILAAVIGAFGAVLLLGSAYVGSVSAPIFLVGYAVSYAAIGYGIVRLLRWAGPRFRIRGAWAGLLGVALIPAYGALMFGTCLGAFTIARGG
ncbi:MAG: hypothetical protein M3P32_06245 [Chloroflexota bacterium]|nr:hypothetical protein [Chloroflexota bacterium]